MKEHRDDLENLIKTEFEQMAEEEMDSIEQDETLDDMPDALKAALRERIDARFTEEMSKKEAETKGTDAKDTDTEPGNTVIIRPKKRKVKFYLILAAALVLMLALGMNSMGENVNVVKFLKGEVGDREVEKTTSSSEDNLVIVEENEEEAYQVIKDTFGAEPVRIMGRPKEMVFEGLELDTVMQTAWMTFDYNGEKIRYIINTTYVDSAWSLDLEDEVTEECTIEMPFFTVDMKVYHTPETETERCSAKYTYKGMEYYLFGPMDKENFEYMIKNLYI